MFIRLKLIEPLTDEMVEVNLKIRFVFILLGPKNDNIDYLEIGRCIGTLMQNKVKISKKNFKSLKELICLQNLKGISWMCISCQW